MDITVFCSEQGVLDFEGIDKQNDDESRFVFRGFKTQDGIELLQYIRNEDPVQLPRRTFCEDPNTRAYTINGLGRTFFRSSSTSFLRVLTQIS